MVGSTAHGRICASGYRCEGWPGGRLAPVPRMRVGYRLMEAMLEWAGKRGFTEAILGAQLQAIGFYERLGFVPEGDVFDDAGIPHRQMRRALT